jgi:succinylglutamate desuccinylase
LVGEDNSLTMKTLFLLLAAFNLTLFASVDEHLLQHNLVDGPKGYGDSGVDYPTYAQVEQGMAALAKKYPTQAKTVQYGKSIKGLNLNLIRIEKTDRNASFANAPAVEISGAIHGNEFLGIEDKLAAYFLDHQSEMPGFSAFLDKGGVLYVVPIVNPDGFVARQRGNNYGADLNRDFDVLPTQDLKLKEVESRSLAQYIDKDIAANHLQLKLTFDYHCCVPALVTPWTYAAKDVSSADQPKFNRIYDIQKANLGYQVGNAIQTVGYLAVGTTVDYFYAKYGAIGLTLEGKYGGEMKAFDKHIKMWDAYFNEVASSL